MLFLFLSFAPFYALNWSGCWCFFVHGLKGDCSQSQVRYLWTWTFLIVCITLYLFDYHKLLIFVLLSHETIHKNLLHISAVRSSFLLPFLCQHSPEWLWESSDVSASNWQMPHFIRAPHQSSHTHTSSHKHILTHCGYNVKANNETPESFFYYLFTFFLINTCFTVF